MLGEGWGPARDSQPMPEKTSSSAFLSESIPLGWQRSGGRGAAGGKTGRRGLSTEISPDKLPDSGARNRTRGVSAAIEMVGAVNPRWQNLAVINRSQLPNEGGQLGGRALGLVPTPPSPDLSPNSAFSSSESFSKQLLLFPISTMVVQVSRQFPKIRENQ